MRALNTVTISLQLTHGHTLPILECIPAFYNRDYDGLLLPIPACMGTQDLRPERLCTRFSLLCCTCAGPELQGTERAEPESPVFDESFALDAQLILGSLVTPGTAARPAPAQRQPAPVEPIQEVRGSDH